MSPFKLTHYQDTGTHYTLCHQLITALVPDTTATCQACIYAWDVGDGQNGWPTPSVAVTS